MTIPLTLVANTQTFGTWLTRTNDIVGVISQNAVTVDASAFGSVSTGNAYINGHLGTSTLFIGNSSANVIISQTAIHASWGFDSNSSGTYANHAYSNVFQTTGGIVNTSGIYGNVISGNSATIGSAYFTANSSLVHAGTLDVTGIANVGSVNALTYVSVGTAMSITPTVIQVGPYTYLNSSTLAVGTPDIPQPSIVAVTNSAGNSTFGATSFNTTWGFNANSTGIYSNTIYANLVTIGATTINTTGFYANLATINNISIGQGLITGNTTAFYTNSVYSNAFIASSTVANVTGLYSNLATINNFVSACTTSNSTGLYANLATLTKAIITTANIVTANAPTLYSNAATITNFTSACTSTNSTGLYANLATINNFVCGVTTSNSTGLYANSLSVNNFIVVTTTVTNLVSNNVSTNNAIILANLGVGNTTANLTANASSIWLGNSSITFFLANAGGLFSNTNISIGGNFIVAGNLVTSGTTLGTGDYIPSSNSYNLGNTTNRWTLWGMGAAFVGTASANILFSNTVSVGNSSGNVSINATSFSGTANNTLFVGSVTAVNVVSNAQLSSNLGNYPLKTDLTNNLTNYPLKTDLSNNLANYSTTTQMNNNLANYATLTTLNTDLGYYTNTTSLAANYTNTTQLSSNLANYTTTIGLTTYTGILGANSISIGNSTVNVTANGSVLLIGNSTVNVSVNSSVLSIANSTVTFPINAPNTAAFTNGQYHFTSGGAWSLSPIISGNVTTLGTSTQNIDSFSMISHYAAEYLIVVDDNNANSKHITTVVMAHDTVSGHMMEYGTIFTNTSLGTFESAVNTAAAQVTLNFTPTSTSTNVRYARKLI